jgi:hypothetical protein
MTDVVAVRAHQAIKRALYRFLLLCSLHTLRLDARSQDRCALRPLLDLASVRTSLDLHR